MKKFFSDFKAFIAKGNVIDMAVGVVIGGAFGKIVTSLVNDIIMPLVSMATGGISVSDWKYVITEADLLTKKAEVAVRYGNFIQLIIDFLIIAFCVFCALRIMMNVNKKLHAKQLEEEAKKKAEAEAAAAEAAANAPKVESAEDILRDIREYLKNK